MLMTNHMKNVNLIEKECSFCHKVKNISEFYWSETNQNHFAACKKCESNIDTHDRLFIFRAATRECLICKITKPKSEFRLRLKTCRDCEIKTEREKEFCFQSGSAKCSACNKIKEINKFYTCKKNGHTSACIACQREKNAHRPPLTPEQRIKDNHRRRLKKSGDGLRVYLVKNARDRALKKNIDFDLTVDSIGVMPSKCPILNIELKKQDGIHGEGSPTLDRIENKLGYINNNVRIISHKANSIKANGTADEHDKIAIYIRENHPYQIEYYI